MNKKSWKSGTPQPYLQMKVDAETEDPETSTEPSPKGVSESEGEIAGTPRMSTSHLWAYVWAGWRAEPFINAWIKLKECLKEMRQGNCLKLFLRIKLTFSDAPEAISRINGGKIYADNLRLVKKEYLEVCLSNGETDCQS